MSLAYYLSRGALSDKRILIIDRDTKQSNDRTWCFWTEEPTAFEPIVHREWRSLGFHTGNEAYVADLGRMRYQMIRGIDFYRYVREQLSGFPNFQFLQTEIERIFEDAEGPCLSAGGEQYRADWIFDSTFDPKQAALLPVSGRFLWQHFYGWMIETPEPVFDTNSAVIMDFRIEQQGAARFCYILPLAPDRGLVECTVLSANVLNRGEYEAILSQYCREVLNLKEYTVVDTEQGKIPMTDEPSLLRRSRGRRIIAVGTPGGAVKSSTGYAFLRIQKQARNIVVGLEKGLPPTATTPGGRFHFYDRLLLHILQHDGGQAREIFRRLFRHNHMTRILRFLDERSSFWEEILIFSRLPFAPFLRALRAVYFRK